MMNEWNLCTDGYQVPPIKKIVHQDSYITMKFNEELNMWSSVIE